MSHFVDIVCRNVLTGAISQFGKISDPDVHNTLIELLDGGPIDGSLYYAKAHENFTFAAYRRVRYTDTEGKARNIIYSTGEIDTIIDDIYQFLRDQTLEIIEYCHDIQYLIGTLNAVSVIKDQDKGSISVLNRKFEEVNLVSILVSAKSAFFRYLTEDTAVLRKDDVSITGKCFKIHKGVEFIARSKRKSASTSFISNSRSSVKMVDIFEFIPYIIVENAIKYGPKDVDIDFEITESSENIVVDISSLGPLLDEGEAERIFDRGFRGRRAVESGVTGHGMGLFQVQKASSHLFAGDIAVRQTGAQIDINGVPFKNTTFSIRVPLAPRLAASSASRPGR